MILNQFLPQEELQKTLPTKQIQNLDFILDGLDAKKNKPIVKDVELLGKIHHAMYLDKYTSSNFRKKLLRYAPPQIKDRYFKEFGIKKGISKMSTKEVSDSITKTCGFEWGNNIETKRFVNFFKYPNYLIPEKSTSKNNTEIVYGGKKENKAEEFEPLKMLWGYQSRIVYEALEELRKSNVRFLIQMPTGTGKTRTAMEILAHTLNEDKSHQIVWLANRSELLEQAVDGFKQVWNHVGQNPIEIYKVWGNEKIPKIKSESCIIFAGYRKLSNLLKIPKSQLKPSIIVLDEAHQILAPTYEQLLNKITSYEKETRVIGLSATPGRGINQEQNELLVQMFHGNLLRIKLDEKFEKQYEENVVEYLEDCGILARANPEPLETNIEYNLSENEWEHLTNLYLGDYDEYPRDFLKNLAEDNKRNLLIVERLKKYADEGKKIIYFSTDVDQSKLVFAALTNLGVKAIHVEDTTEKEFRKQIIKKFKDTNEINVICNYQIFSTGLDIPKLDVVFIGRPVNSPVLFNQIVGRGTRGVKMRGKDFFILAQVIDKIESKHVSFSPYANYAFWDANWKKK